MAGGLKEVRERIGSVQNTMQITSAMKMVSAAKLRRAQDAITRMRPYAEKIQAILANVSATLDSSDGVFSEERKINKALVVAITSNRGLCGGFNNNSMKIAKSAIAKHQENGSEVFVLPLGKKAFESFEREGYSFAEGFGDAALTVFDNLDFDTVSEIAQTIMNGFVTKQWDSVELSYSQFKNAAVQIPTHEPYLPLLPISDETTSTDYILEPSREEIVENILPNALKVQLYKALLDSNAAEHGARMTAMHSATENAGDLLQELKISYNKARQASITTEILEIVAGSEALGA
ncbi:MAG TPA: ATP synthase F1 subunit gamma [Flavobacteriales bacterium]|nr:ATP synthase F1 subunit gamma [Flavobacteriales bacterium]HIB77133.1 ATP synthase F1 subunit gamma [Flavobacteriales bacterium]HIN42346.1 ATP synthase F1 subunit gamma [Flavobacteriales bacterium]HIO16603.1 ATP synthase F1 subunit gamma [Flavobacteriales bacterium]